MEKYCFLTERGTLDYFLPRQRAAAGAITKAVSQAQLLFPAKSTHLDGASHLGGTGEDVNVRDQDVQLLEFPLLGGHVLQPQVASGAGAWLGVSREAGLQEVAPEVGRSQEEACLCKKGE